MNKKKLAAYAAIAIIFGAVGAFLGNQARDAIPGAPGNDSPNQLAKADAQSPESALFAQTLNDLSDQPQALRQWQGKPLLVNFWATWCAPCVAEMPELASLAKEYAQKQVNVIGIGIDSPAAMREFAAKHQISYPLYVGGMGGTELTRAFGNTSGGLPFTVLIGADGKLRKTYIGKLKFEQLKADLATL